MFTKFNKGDIIKHKHAGDLFQIVEIVPNWYIVKSWCGTIKKLSWKMADEGNKSEYERQVIYFKKNCLV